jgi:LemA protein
MTLLILLLVLILLIFGYALYAYNRLARLRNTLRTEWADVDVLLKKRADLIPNLVETVKGYSAHERGVLEKIALARSAASKSGSARSADENELSGFVASVIALKEQYPDLKASENFMKLEAQLFAVEEEIATRRTNYNDIVKAYNDFVLKFPANALAAIVGFSIIEPFEFTGSREVPKVDLEYRPA